ncbi:uncharacterized protein LOC143300233 [Babylonia areolata]|uniref:uncharacterized protein LOC143300233 n=1 Tax=Babylonia areolata TaxID=304850 RepID=UPI003FD2AC7B
MADSDDPWGSDSSAQQHSPAHQADDESDDEDDDWFNKSIDESDDEDDDWFNKSIDEFDVPPLKKTDDRWKGEDEDEEEEEEENEEEIRRRRNAAHRNISASRVDSARTAEITVICSRVVTLLVDISPETKRKRFRLKLGGSPRGKEERSVAEAGGRGEPSGDSVRDRDGAPEGEKKGEEPESAAAGQDYDREEIAGTGAWEDIVLTGKPLSPEEKAQIRPEMERGQWEELTTDVDSDDDNGDSDGRQEEELSEEWFQKRLKVLPTLFGHPFIHRVSRARLSKVLDLIGKDVEERTSQTGDENGDWTDGSATDAPLQGFSLFKTTQGDYPFVGKFKLGSSLGPGEGNLQRKPNTEWLCSLRSLTGANFKVVLTWLLGRKQEAEQEARHLVGQYPFSLVSAANLFYILWRRGERKEAAELLPLFSALERRKPDIYDGIMCEDQVELAECYTELGSEFILPAVDIMEKEVQKKPHKRGWKWLLASTLWQSTNAGYLWTRPVQDMTAPLLKAIDICLELIQDSGEDVLGLKAAAASVLGEIIHSESYTERQHASKEVLQRTEAAGWNASKCFDTVLQAKEVGRYAPCLIRAGKYYRYTKQLQKSLTVLKKAVALQDSPLAHHHLGLTLKKQALTERRRAWENSKHQLKGKKPFISEVGPRRGASKQKLGVISRSRIHAGDSAMKSIEVSMKSEIYKNLSRKDRYVTESMHHLNKAIILSHNECNSASYDLGLMYKALGEYNEALGQFLVIAQIDTEPCWVVNAFEQSALVLLEKCSLEENETRARTLEKDGRSLLTMAVLIQSRLVREFRGDRPDTHAVWRSCYSLGQYLRLQQEVEGVFKSDSSAEIWLLRLLRVYADTLPVLTFLQQITQRDADGPGMITKINKYWRDERHEDAILLTHLLHLTEQGRQMNEGDWKSGVRTLVLVARAKLLKDVNAKLVDTIETNMAKRLFRWAFEDACTNATFTGHQHAPSANLAPSASSRAEFPQVWGKEGAALAPPPAETQAEVTENGLEFPTDAQETRTKDSQDATTTYTGGTGAEMGSDQLWWTKEGDSESLVYHVVLVHDPLDPDSAHFALELRHVLQEVCGLVTHLAESGPKDVMQKATTQAIDSTRQVLVIHGCKELSPELESYIHYACAKFPEVPDTVSSVSTLTLGNRGALPELLRSRPSLQWPSASVAPQGYGRLTVKWVESVCKLFCFLVGLEMTF